MGCMGLKAVPRHLPMAEDTIPLTTLPMAVVAKARAGMGAGDRDAEGTRAFLQAQVHTPPKRTIPRRLQPPPLVPWIHRLPHPLSMSAPSNLFQQLPTHPTNHVI